MRAHFSSGVRFALAHQHPTYRAKIDVVDGKH